MPQDGAAALPSVSVIVPVYNGAAALAGCLDSLARQTYPAARTEVLVVDNGSTEDIAAVVGRHLPSATLLHEPVPGSYAARNRGLQHATGEVLAFTDADCLPQPAWLAAGVAALRDRPAAGLVVGPVEIFPQDGQRPTGAELYDMEHGIRQIDYLEKQHCGATANLFTRRAVVERVGPFNAALKSGGDIEWGQRVWAAGFPQVYCPEALVLHPARRTLGTLTSKARRIVGGRIDRRALQSDAKSRVRRWASLVVPPLDQRLRMAGLRRRYGRAAAWRYYRTVYAVRLAVLTEELRLAFGGSSRR